MNVLRKLLMAGGSIVANKELARRIGLHPAVFFAELLAKEDYFEGKGQLKDGWFFNTIENMEKDTTLSVFQQREVIRKLRGLGLIDYKLEGLPAMRYFKINEDKLYELLDFTPPKTSLRETHKLSKRNSLTCEKKVKGNNNNLNNNKCKNNKEVKTLPLNYADNNKEGDNGGGLTDEQLAGGCYVRFPEDYDYKKENTYLEVIENAEDKEKAIKTFIDNIDDEELEKLIKITNKEWREFQRQYPNNNGREELHSLIVEITLAREMAEAGM